MDRSINIALLAALALVTCGGPTDGTTATQTIGAPTSSSGTTVGGSTTTGTGTGTSAGTSTGAPTTGTTAPATAGTTSGPEGCRDSGDCEPGEECWLPSDMCPTCSHPVEQCESDAECDALNPGDLCQLVTTPCNCGQPVLESATACGPPCTARGATCVGYCNPMTEKCEHFRPSCASDFDCSRTDICVDTGWSPGICVIGTSCDGDSNCPEDSPLCVRGFCADELGACVTPE